jgi:hypothetical protein
MAIYSLIGNARSPFHAEPATRAGLEEYLVEMTVDLVGLANQRVKVVGQPLATHRTVNQPANIDSNGRVPGLLQQFCGALDELQTLFPRRFTPQGCLDQSLGEVLAAWTYNLELVTGHARVSLAKTTDGRMIQLKVTRSQKGTVGLYDWPEALLVLQLSGRDLVELYNGPVVPAWEKAGKTKRNGERRIPVSRLKCLGLSVPADHRLPQCKPLC